MKLALFLLPIILVVSPVAAQNPKGILVGVESKRLAYTSFKARYRVDVYEPVNKSFEISIEVSPDGKRFESPEFGLILCTQDEKYALRPGQGSDLKVYPTDDKQNRIAEFCFDPRILGLAAQLYEAKTLDWCLGFDRGRTFKLLDSPSADIRVIRSEDDNGLVKDYRVDESFCVRRIDVTSLNGQSNTTIISTYDGSKQVPVEVDVEKTVNGEYEQKYKITELMWESTAISPERFELANCDIPLNTMVFDKRIDEYVGFWNGVDFRERPNLDGKKQDGNDSEGSSFFVYAGIALIGSAVLFVVGRKLAIRNS